ncbi:MAG: MFS transporter, partial [Neisseria elongata]
MRPFSPPESSPARPYIILVLVVGFVGSMQTCLNVSTWVLMSELFPLRVRAVGMGLSAFCGWMMNGLLSLVFPVILGALGLTGSFFGFMVVNVLIAVLMWRNLPETRGKTLELAEVPTPQLRAGEVLVKVHATGVNRA